jgi:hypothetical protein
VIVKGLDGFFGFIAMGLQEEKEALFIKVFPIVLDLILGDVLMEFMNLFLLILVVFDMSIVEESASLLALLRFLLFLYFSF